jgi:phospholipase C
MITGTTLVSSAFPEAVRKAFSINPDHGTTYLDAEHIVILMQENRSFDHAYGALQGVRGFRDPRVHRQQNGRKVWFQTDASGQTYPPFRLDIKDTNVTWIGGLPHSWHDQIDARNKGRYDKWLIAKAHKDFPFTLGHYSRQDLPFYYSLADAFTICDQAFCSSLTGTTPNRLYLWTGTIRKDASDPARVQNGDTDYDKEADWKTFPERLEDAGVPWRIYQNEISIDSGFADEEDAWLSNFTDNPIEWFSQYRVRFGKARRRHVQQVVATWPDRISQKEQASAAPGLSSKEITKLLEELKELKEELRIALDEKDHYHDAAWAALSDRDRSLNQRAFAVNEGDPEYRSLASHLYHDGEVEREVSVPKGDVLHQFRSDVESGNLPAVSWLVAPERFSDHPGSAWYGAWYLSEAMNILTKNPDVWKKTIFILCYDENDGYFDHVPPFVAPHPNRPDTGRTSDGLDTSLDVSNAHGRDHSIGLGYRVPLVVASPWSRGGCVNSEVFDHTSIIMLIEKWLEGKHKKVVESNISPWRRTVCGDLSSVFRPYAGESYSLPRSLERDAVVEQIHRAKFAPSTPSVGPIGQDQLETFDLKPFQEVGTRPSCPLKYELEVNAELKGDKLIVSMEAGNRRFGKNALGSPFNVYAYHGSDLISRAYAAKAGSGPIIDSFDASAGFHVRVDGPNGFMREFCSSGSSPNVKVAVHSKGDNLAVTVENKDSHSASIEIRDESYGLSSQKLLVGGLRANTHYVPTTASHGWYDFSVEAEGLVFRYAGRLETGKWSITDPSMA